MSKREIKTDFWVKSLLEEAGIYAEPQGTSIKELNEALSTASKRGTGNTGYPEFVAVVKDFVIVIEDKADLSKHEDKLGETLSIAQKSIEDYALNGALFYARKIACGSTFKKIFAIGVSGNEKRHRITPLYVDETAFYRELPDIESFICFNQDNIDDYYTSEVLEEETDHEKELADILKDAAALHEDLRNYGQLGDKEKPIVVSGVLLALREAEYKGFSLKDLSGDTVVTDGEKIYKAIEQNLKRSNVSPEVKRDKLLSQFSIIKDMQTLNVINEKLGKTPLKYYAEFLDERIYKAVKYVNSSEDYLGRFYSEFMSYSGGDGQSLGVVLTPKHITQLFCDLVDLKPTDVVLDPCCGTAGFLIAAMHQEFKQIINSKGLRKRESIEKDSDILRIRKNNLFGIEIRPDMFAIATTNMILRGDGNSNLVNGDFLNTDSKKLQLSQPTVGMMNPPYSQGSKANPNLYEICFVEHLLDSLLVDARCVVIIPQSSVTGKTTMEQNVKTNILKHHTLEGVITLNPETFYGVGTMPCIAVFTAGRPHPDNKECKFINYEDDGYKVAPHLGLLETETAKDKKAHLLDVWFDRVDADTKFCVKTTIKDTDEWLHSFYYFNDELPTEDDFDRTISEYLSFEFSSIMQGRKYLFEDGEKNA